MADHSEAAAEVGVLVVGHLEELRPLLADEGKLLGLGGPRAVGVDPVGESAHEDERLEGRAGLAVAVGGQVERGGVVVRAAHHRLDLAGVVVDRHQRGAGPDAGQAAGDRVLGRGLKLGIDRRLHVEPAAEHHAGRVLVDQVLGHPGGEVGLLGLHVGRVDLVLVGQGGDQRLLVLSPGDHLLLEHAGQHEVAPGPRLGRVLDRVVQTRRCDHSRQQRGLRGLDVEHLARILGHHVVFGNGLVGEGGVLAGRAQLVRLVTVTEIGAHGGFDAVRAITEINGIEVLGEYSLLRPFALEVVGQRGLAQLLEHRAVSLCGERVLHELLGDRGTTLNRLTAADVLPQRAGDTRVVDALVLVETAVLDGDHGVLEVRRDVALVDEDAIEVAGELGDPAVDVRARLAHLVASGPIGEQDRVLSRPQLGPVIERRQVAGHRHQHAEDGRDRRDDRQAGDHGEQPELLEPRLDRVRGRRGRRSLARAHEAGPALGREVLDGSRRLGHCEL